MTKVCMAPYKWNPHCLPLRSAGNTGCTLTAEGGLHWGAELFHRALYHHAKTQPPAQPLLGSLAMILPRITASLFLNFHRSLFSRMSQECLSTLLLLYKLWERSQNWHVVPISEEIKEPSVKQMFSYRSAAAWGLVWMLKLIPLVSKL